MGYYTGNGVVSGGAEEISIAQTALVGEVLNVFRKDVRSVVRKSGVSLATAQAAHASMTSQKAQLWDGSWFFWVASAKGTKKDVTYSQIGDSNLYELNITNETLSCSDDGTTWTLTPFSFPNSSAAEPSSRHRNPTRRSRRSA